MSISQLKEELLSIIKNQQSELLEEIEKRAKESNSIIEENKRIIECFLQQKYQIDKIEFLEKMANKSNDSLISHEIRIANNYKELSSIKTKYDKIVLDNLMLSGFIGPSCQFKNLSAYIKHNISEFAKLKSENDNMKKETREFKIRLDGASKNIINLIDGGVMRCNQYADSRINDFHVILENKIKDMNDKLMDVRMKNLQFQSKIEEQINNLKINYEEKMAKQKDDLSQIINNKIEYLNMNYSTIEKNPKILEIDDIKKNISNLENELKEIKNNINNLKSDNNNNNYYSYNSGNLLGDKNKKNKRYSIFLKENDYLNKFYDSFKSTYNNNNKNISSSQRISDSAKRSYHTENNKNNLNDFPMKNDKKRLLSPVKSRFHKNIAVNSNSGKKEISYKVNNNDDNPLNLIRNMGDNSDLNRYDNMPKKYFSKTSLISINEKMNVLMHNSDNNPDKTKNKNNNINNIQNNNKINNNQNKKINKTKNDNINSRTPKDEKSQSFISISNSSKQDNSNEEQKNLELSPNILFINEKGDNNIINNNNNYIKKNKNFENGIQKNIINKQQETNNKSLQNKYKKLNLDIGDNNESKINSKININNSQENYRKEIEKEFFTKYNKGNMSINLNLIKNKANLDLYNYSTSPPDNRFLLNAKINEIIEPPPKEFFFDKNNINEKNIKLDNTKRNVLFRPSLNMQLFYGTFNDKIKEKNKKRMNGLSNSEQKININIKNNKNGPKKINQSLGKTIDSEYIKTEKIFTMTSYKNKK